MQDLSVIVKVVRGCNLRCTYCYAGNYQFQSLSVMSREVLERLIRESLSIASSRLEFCWHGGEPLLAGRRFFSEAIALQNQYKSPEQKIVNALQTNGTLVDEEWIEFLEKNDFGPGVSIDGPAILHDQQRPFANGAGSHSQIVQAIRVWQERGHSVPILCVVTSASANHPVELFDFFIKNGIKSIDFLPCSKINRTTGRVFDDGVSPQAYADFMIKVFNRWWQLNDPTIRIRYFENVLQGLLGGRPTLCKFAATCSHFLTIDTDGTVYPCDDFVEEPDFAYGNILETDLKVMMAGERRARFVKEVMQVGRVCSDCKWFEICKGGCSYYRYMRHGRFDNVNYYCLARKRIFEHVSRVALPVADIVRGRLGCTTQDEEK